MSPMDNAVLIIDAFGGLRPLAKKLGIAVSTVQGWKKRGVIPDSHHEAIEKAAQEEGINLENLDYLPPLVSSDDTAGEAAPPQQGVEKNEKEEEPEEKKEGFDALLSGEAEPMPDEEEFMGAFTSDDSHSDSVDGISEDIWAHAALPRSTGVHWAILLSIISIVMVVSRPIWSGPIDAKLSSQLGHHGEDSHGEDSHGEGDYTTDGKTVSLPPDLIARLEAVEDVTTLIAGSREGVEAGIDFKPLEDRFVLFENRQGEMLDSLSALRNRGDAGETRYQALSILLDRLNNVNDSLDLRLQSLERRQNQSLVEVFEQRIALLFRFDLMASRLNQGLDFKNALTLLENAMDIPLKSATTESRAELYQYAEKGVDAFPFLASEYSARLPLALSIQEEALSKGWYQQLKARLRSLIHIRPVNPSLSHNPLIQAEGLLLRGNLDDVLPLVRRESARLEGRTGLEDWLDRATRRHEARKALAQLRGEILGDIEIQIGASVNQNRDNPA